MFIVEEERRGSSGSRSTRSRSPSVTSCKDKNVPTQEKKTEEIEEEKALDSDIKFTIENRINTNKKLGPNMHSDFAKLCEKIVTSGLDDKEKAELTEKFPTPENCVLIDPPKLNVEVANAIDESVILRDNRIIKKQLKITACLAACSRILDLEMSKQEEGNEVIPILSDVVSLLADLQYDESVVRKSIILANINSSLRSTFMTTNIDQFLFGGKLTEAINSHKALENTTKVLRAPSRSQRTFQRTNSKNSKPPPRHRNKNPSTSGGKHSSHQRNSSHRSKSRSRREPYNRKRRW